MSLPIVIERLSVEPIQVCALFPGASNVIPIGGIPGPPGPLAERLQAITFMVDGGGAPIQPGIKGDLFIPYDCNILGWTMIADQLGTMELDIERDNPAAFPPTPADSIVAAAPPALINQQFNQGGVAGWQTAIPAASVLRYRVTNALNIQRLTIALTVERQ